jgi:hypothetical protein
MMSFIFYQKKENKYFELLSVVFHCCRSTAVTELEVLSWTWPPWGACPTFQIAIHFGVSFQIIIYDEKCKARWVTFTLFIYSFLTYQKKLFIPFCQIFIGNDDDDTKKKKSEKKKRRA